MIQKANISDAESIHNLITSFAKTNVMLPRSLNSIYEHIRDFWIIKNDIGEVVGCAALHVIGWDNLAEIRSLSVSENIQKTGLGKELVETCIKEAKELGIKKVFALTFVPGFFAKLAFKEIDRKKLPHKIWSDCIDCPFFMDCKEIAVIKNV